MDEARTIPAASPRGIPCGRLLVLLVCGWAIGLAPDAASGQSPLDIFGSHYGGYRTPSVAPESWIAGSVMLLTQYDGRWSEYGTEPIPWESYDGLSTSAGYNYLTFGFQRVLSNRPLCCFTDRTAHTYAVSVHVGITGDSLLASRLQGAFHDFRRIPHVYRGHVSDGSPILGVDAQWLIWPSRRDWAFGLQGSLGSHHRELSGVLFARLKYQTPRLFDWAPHAQFSWMLTAGRVGSKWVLPERVSERYGTQYWSLRMGWDVEDTFGASLVYTHGLFEGERVRVGLCPSIWRHSWVDEPAYDWSS